MRKILVFLGAIFVLCALSIPVFASNGESERYVVELILIGCIGGAIAALTTAIAIERSYKRKIRSEKYPLDKYVKMTITSSIDFYKGSYVTKISSPKSKR